YYAIASGEVPPKTKASVHKKKADSDTTPKDKPPKDPDEKVHEKTGTDEGASEKPEVLDVPEHHSNSEEESWTFSDGDDDDEDDDLSTFSTNDQEEQDDEEEQEEDDEDEEEISD
ncbi:hypothetical protein Tco_0423362, partial [Tanacetum coccineum]